MCGEEGEGQVGGAQVPQWSLKFLEQDKVCACVYICMYAIAGKYHPFTACMLEISTSNSYTGSETSEGRRVCDIRQLTAASV